MGLIRKYTRLSPHLRLALILAPLLAVGGYILAGFYQPGSGDEPDDGPRPLQLSGNCRLPEGVCKLLHREIAVNVGAEQQGEATEIYLATSVPLEGAVVGLENATPVTMTTRGSLKRWKARLSRPLRPGDHLHLALVTRDHRYFADLPATPAHGD